MALVLARTAEYRDDHATSRNRLAVAVEFAERSKPNSHGAPAPFDLDLFAASLQAGTNGESPTSESSEPDRDLFLGVEAKSVAVASPAVIWFLCNDPRAADSSNFRRAFEALKAEFLAGRGSSPDHLVPLVIAARICGDATTARDAADAALRLLPARRSPLRTEIERIARG